MRPYWFLVSELSLPSDWCSTLPYQNSVRHEPFLEALGAAKSSADPRWKPAAAGYLMLRCFDEWRVRNNGGGALQWSISEIHDCIERYAEIDSPLYNILSSIAQTFIEEADPVPADVSRAWYAYAEFLNDAGYQALAHHIRSVASEDLSAALSGSEPPLQTILL